MIQTQRRILGALQFCFTATVFIFISFKKIGTAQQEEKLFSVQQQKVVQQQKDHFGITDKHRHIQTHTRSMNADTYKHETIHE